MAKKVTYSLWRKGREKPFKRKSTSISYTGSKKKKVVKVKNPSAKDLSPFLVVAGIAAGIGLWAIWKRKQIEKRAAEKAKQAEAKQVALDVSPATGTSIPETESIEQWASSKPWVIMN